jgi:hypothetical protein
MHHSESDNNRHKSKQRKKIRLAHLQLTKMRHKHVLPSFSCIVDVMVVAMKRFTSCGIMTGKREGVIREEKS